MEQQLRTHKHKAKRANWECSEALKPQSPPSVTYFLQQGHTPRPCQPAPPTGKQVLKEWTCGEDLQTTRVIITFILILPITFCYLLVSLINEQTEFLEGFIGKYLCSLTKLSLYFPFGNHFGKYSTKPLSNEGMVSSKYVPLLEAQS